MEKLVVGFLFVVLLFSLGVSKESPKVVKCSVDKSTLMDAKTPNYAVLNPECIVSPDESLNPLPCDEESVPMIAEMRCGRVTSLHEIV